MTDHPGQNSDLVTLSEAIRRWEELVARAANAERAPVIAAGLVERIVLSPAEIKLRIAEGRIEATVHRDQQNEIDLDATLIAVEEVERVEKWIGEKLREASEMLWAQLDAQIGGEAELAEGQMAVRWDYWRNVAALTAREFCLLRHVRDPDKFDTERNYFPDDGPRSLGQLVADDLRIIEASPPTAWSKDIRLPLTEWIALARAKNWDLPEFMEAVSAAAGLDRVEPEAPKTESPAERRERLRRRRDELKRAGHRNFLQIIAKEEKVNVSRVQQILKDASKRPKKQTR